MLMGLGLELAGGFFARSLEVEVEDGVDPDVGVKPLLSFLTLALLPNEAKNPPEDLPDEAEVGVRMDVGPATVAEREGRPRCGF